jgi:large conductance mechanosensitive channel
MMNVECSSFDIHHSKFIIGCAMLKEFREFIARGNVVDLAVAVVIGAAFGKIVTTIVEGVLMPPIGMATGRIDFASLFYVLDTSRGVPASLADAKAKGIPVIAYGQLLNDIITFVIVAFAVFLIVRQVNRIKSAEAPATGPTTRECPECLSVIPIKAVRCAHCTTAVRPA